MFVALILSNAFKGLLREHIINPPKWWFHSIDEIIEAPSDYDIFIPSDKITRYSVQKLANFDPKFKKLIKRLKLIPFRKFFDLEHAESFLNGKCAGFATSYNWDALGKIIGEKEIVIHQIRYEHVLDVRFIRKDFQFADKIILL